MNNHQSAAMLALFTPVSVRGQKGVIVGRAFGHRPYYDVRLASGAIIFCQPNELQVTGVAQRPANVLVI